MNTDLQKVVQNVSDELGEQAALVAQLDEVLADLAPVLLRHDPDSLSVLQSIDLLGQALRGMAAFTQNLSRDVPEDIRISLEESRKALKLARQRERFLAA